MFSSSRCSLAAFLRVLLPRSPYSRDPQALELYPRVDFVPSNQRSMDHSRRIRAHLSQIQIRDRRSQSHTEYARRPEGREVVGLF